ncbi:MAG TPA: isoleucine--tRNA ligase [Gemmatimonadales bacterium]|nr:isoleucine--tRNA ligase [Gemmatimonadales bacterium]
MSSLPAWPDRDADAFERELLARWTEERLFHQVQEASREGTPFVFFEGPPTANGRPGVHHVFSRTIKDLFCRFRVMQGRSVTRIAGWDTHGLPVEIEVEKSLGLSGKKAIEAYGIAEFNRLCRESVLKYQKDWERLSDRIGYWLDYERPYVTFTPEYVESVWWLLKELHRKGRLSRGHRVLPYCPRCGTVLSSHELAQGYELIHDQSVFVAFPLDDGSGRELAVWTTTPWTLPSNVAAAVHPDLEYGEYRRADGRVLVFATACETELGPLLGLAADAGPGSARLRVFPGRHLVGARYHRPLDVVPLPGEGEHSVVVAGEFVTAQEGTGIVHMAPAFGADDYEAARRNGLAMLRPITPEGTFAGTTWPELEGRLVTAPETNSLIVRRLEETGRHLRTATHVHDYPHCWRCSSKLIYFARDSWFVSTSAFKDRLVALNEGIEWHPPEVGSGRFGDWLANNVDWALSRERYWGTPLPVWVSDRDPGCIEVIGSYAELAQRIGRPLPADFDPHRPGIDRLTWPAPDGGTMRRVPEVIDTWFDSGAMPSAQWHYPFEHATEFERHFPADFICEGVDQTRGWFYSLLAIGAGVFDRAPYRHVLVNELVLDAEGQKMSKSRGNVVDPDEVVREFGADAVRLFLLAASEVWKTRRFDRAAIAEVAGGFLNTLRNIYTFHALYAGGRIPPPPAPADASPLDRWFLSRLAGTVREVNAAWEGYNPTAGVRAVMSFVVDDLSNWWLRQSRARFWAPDREAEPAAVGLLQYALVTVSRLLAPAAPFTSDWIHRALTGGSVHLARFPEPVGEADAELDSAMAAVRRLASLARAAREERSLRVRQPLRRMKVAIPRSADSERFRGMLPLLAQEVNVRQVEVVASDAELVRLRARPNFRELGRTFGSRTQAAASAAASLSPDQLRRLEGGASVEHQVNGAAFEFQPAHVTVEREVATDWLVQSSGSFVAALDPDLTEELRREGLAREIVNRVQRLRKDAGYAYTTRIEVWVDGPAPLLEAVQAHAGFIQGETLARSLRVGERAPAADRQEAVEIDGHPAVLAVVRHPADFATNQ